MIKVKEIELFRVVEKFDNKNIILQFDDILKANVKIKNCKITYNRRNGILKIMDNENIYEVNITPAYCIERNENYTKLEIYLDNSLDIIINVDKGIQ